MTIETLTKVRCSTPGGKLAYFATRDTTNDAALVFGIMGEDEYRFGQLESLSGWAVDIGAHIGIPSVLLALDHPDLRVVAVEAIPANIEMLRRNVELNGLSERIEVVDAGATDDATTSVPITFDYEWAGIAGGKSGPVVDVPYVTDSRYIGNIFSYSEGEQSATTLQRPGIGLTRLLDERGIERVTLGKIDCEGCEWSVLTSPSVGRFDRWIGEYHGDPGLAGIHALLDATHVVTERADAHTGLFDAVHR